MNSNSTYVRFSASKKDNKHIDLEANFDAYLNAACPEEIPVVDRYYTHAEVLKAVNPGEYRALLAEWQRQNKKPGLRLVVS